MKKKKSIWRKAFSLVLYAIGGVAIGVLAAEFGIDLLPSRSDLGLGKPAMLALLLSALPVGFFISVMLHELGHMLFGVMAGMKPVSFMVGPLSWEFSEDRGFPKLRLHPFFFGGLAFCLPSQDRDRLRKQYISFVSGGPVASFLLALLCLAGLKVANGTVAIYLGFTMAFTLFLGLFNLIPHTVAGLHTDGGRLFDALKGGRKYDEAIAQFCMSTYLLSPATPAEWPDQYIEALMGAKEGSAEWRSGHYYRYCQSIHVGDIEAAKGHLLKYAAELEELPQVLGGSYAREKALFQALYEGQIDEAASTLEKYSRSTLMQEDHTAHLSQAIMELNSGRLDQARKELQAAEVGLAKAKFKGLLPLADAEISALKTLLAEKEAAMQNS